MKIFNGTSNKPLAQSIAEKMGLALSPVEIHVFPDGEKRVKLDESVVGQECIVVQSTGIPVNENYMELFFIVDALKRSGAQSVTAVVPYMGYQRQDHIFREGEARSFAVIVETLQAVGVDRLITFDLHSIKIPELFKIPVVHLSALQLFADIVKQKKWDSADTVLISPDMGGIRRLEKFSELLGGLPTASIEKDRNLETGDISANKISGVLRERAIILDDMISSGETIVQAIELLTKNGVEEIMVFATHPVFSQNAQVILKEAKISVLYVTDSIHVTKEKQFPKLEILSMADLIAKELFEK